MKVSTMLFRHRVSFTLAAILAVWTVGFPGAATAQSTITVDTTADVVDFGGAQTAADLPGPDGRTSLREAAIAATNTEGADTVAFDIPTTDPGFDGSGLTIVVVPDSPSEGALTLGDDGTTLDGTTQPGGYPITVRGSVEDRIGYGLLVHSSGNTVKGLGWEYFGGAFLIYGDDNLITDATVRNNRSGVVVANSDDDSGGNAVTDSTVADNDQSGISFSDNAGGTVSGNTITGNGDDGVSINDSDGASVTDNVINGNRNGIDVFPFGETHGTITGNTITGNTQDGVALANTGFTVSQNSISDNAGLGIDWVGVYRSGVTGNHKGGAPNYPEHMSVTESGGATVIEGRITDFASPGTVPIEVFANDVPDPSGHGEGLTFLGTATADGKGRFTLTLPSGLAGQYVTATATGSDGTSEFSETVQVQPDNGGKGSGSGKGKR